MATEIPTQIEFQHLLGHTFPGFFSAITLFMLIDIWSPLDLTTLVIKDLNALISFAGFILLIGTILGIIIDGIHHSLIEDDIFDNFISIENAKRELPCNHCDDKKNCKFFFNPKDGERKVNHYHYFKLMELDKAKTIHEYLVKVIYSYSEFYANTFTSLCFFSLVIPFYLFDVFQIRWSYSIFTAILSVLMAGICLNSSYNAYKAYITDLYSVIHGCVESCKKGTQSGGEGKKGNIGYSINLEIKS